METRRKFSREFKLEAVKMVVDRGIALEQAARDLDLNENMLRRWIREFSERPPRRVSLAWKYEARAGRDCLTAKGSCQTQDGARHPKKSRSVLREGIDVRCNFIVKHRGVSGG
jgi:transposase-like protein